MTDDLAAQIEAIRVNLIKGMSNKRAGKKPTMDEVAIIDAYNQLDYLRIEAKAHLDRDRKMKAELADGERETIAILSYQSYIEDQTRKDKRRLRSRGKGHSPIGDDSGCRCG